jgi:hypothetical protein
MDEAAATWIRRLPWRWGLWGLCAGMIWVFGALAAGGTSLDRMLHPFNAAFLFLQLVLPVGLVGLLWGWSERLDFQRRPTESLTRLHGPGGDYVFRQVGKGTVAGLLLMLLLDLPAIVAKGAWSGAAGLLGSALLGALAGIVVGLLARWRLRRRLAAPSAA